MTTEPAVSAPSAPANPRSRVITASLVGTTIEFYDFYAYATEIGRASCRERV